MGEYNTDRLNNITGTGVETSHGVWKDADTFSKDGQSYRVAGLSADETWKVVDGQVKPGQWLGNVQTQEFGKLADTMGFGNIVDTGETTYDRKVVDLTDKHGRKFTDALYEQGLVRDSKWATQHQQELAERGKLNRWMDDYIAEQRGEEVVRTPWDTARDNINDFKRKSITGWKEAARNEQELSASQVDGSDYSQYLNNEVQFRHGGQDITGKAYSPFSAGIGQGWNSIKESAAGGISILGDILESDYLTNMGELDLRELQYDAQNAPTFVQDIGQVEFGKNFSDYLAGMAGVSLPYMLGIIGSAGAGSFIAGSGLAGSALGLTAPAWVYSGEVYNNMEGDKDTKNAGVAIAGGIIMGMADRLGMQALFKTGKAVLGKDSIEQLTKAYAKKNGVNPAVAREAVVKAQLETAQDLLKGIGGIAGTFAKNTLQGSLVEGTTEAVQETTGFLASHFGSELTRGLDVNTDELKNIALNAAVGGALLGGGISGVSGTFSQVKGAKQLQHEVNNATRDASEGYLDGDVDTQMQSRLDETHEGDTLLEMEGEAKQAEKNRKAKGWVQRIKEAPSQYFRKRGSIWNQKIIEDSTMPQAFKDTVKVINTLFMPSNQNYVQGTDMWSAQRVSADTMIRRSRDLASNLTATLGYKNDTEGKQQASKDYTNWRKAKINNKNFKLKNKAQEDAMQAIHEGITEVTEVLRNVVVNTTGEKLNKLDDWFIKSLSFSPETIVKNKTKFVNALVEGSGYTKAKALQLYDNIIQGKPFEGTEESELFDISNNKTKERVAKLTDNALLADFFEQDLFKKLDTNIKDMTRYAYDTKYLGKHDEKLNKLLSLAKKQAGAKWDPEYALAVKETVDGNRGRFKPIQSEKAKEAIKNISFIGAITQLDTSMLASLPEAALVLNAAHKEGGLAGVVKKIWKANAQHFTDATKEGLANVQKNRGIPTPAEINPSAADVDLQRQSFYGGGYGSKLHGVLGALDVEHGQRSIADARREKILENFFRANLLKGFTDASRVGRLAIANDVIFGDLDIIVGFYNKNGGNSNYANDAYDRMRELKINPVEMANQYEQMVKDMETFPTDMDTHQFIYKNYPELYQTMELARASFVDNMLARPTVVDRPLWYSNPNLRLFVQYQGFLSTFTSHILPRLYKQAKKADPELKFQAFATAASMLALAALGQHLKDEWKYGEPTPYIRDDWKYTQRAIASSGLLGTGERFLEIINPIYSFGQKRGPQTTLDQVGSFVDQHKDQLGPFLGTLEKGWDVAASGFDSDKTEQLVPLIGRNKAWKDFDLNRAVNNLTANIYK